MASLRLTLVLAAVAAFIVPGGASAQPKPRPQTAPETFTSPLQARTETGASAATIRIEIERYTSERDRKTMTDALAFGGYPAFVPALRKAPAVGTLVIGDVKATLRWAREQTTEKGREISLVTDMPVYFIGGGRADAKPRAGFELAVVRITIDPSGFGTGTMAAAARVKPDGQGGVVIEDYAEEPIKLTFVHRVVK